MLIVITRIVLLVIASLLLFWLYLYLFQAKIIFPATQEANVTLEQARRLGFTKNILHEGDIVYERRSDNAKAWILFFHGNGGTAIDRTYFFEPIKDLPFNIVLVEYPGYHGAPGSPSQASLLAQSLRVFSHYRANSPLPFILYGESMGTSVSTYLASKRRIRGLILQSPFASIAALAADTYPKFMIDLILKHPMPTKDWAKSVDVPVLVLHGSNDQVVPIDHGKDLFQAFSTSKKEFVEIAEASHFSDSLHTKEYWEKVRSFLEVTDLIN